MTFRALATAAALLAITLVPAHSATMTFDGIPDGGSAGPDGHVWAEDGITAVGNDIYFGISSWDVPGAAHMTDVHYGWPDTITFSMSHLFSPVSFDIMPLHNYFCLDWDYNGCGIAFNNVGLTGMRDGSTIAEDSFYMGTEPWTYFFGAEFSDLDTLIIAILLPGPDAPTGTCTNAPCTSMSIDNVSLSPVPLPAPLLLFLTGLGALALLGRAGKAGAMRRTAF
jgi:hypothetical protein